LDGRAGRQRVSAHVAEYAAELARERAVESELVPIDVAAGHHDHAHVVDRRGRAAAEGGTGLAEQPVEAAVFARVAAVRVEIEERLERRDVALIVLVVVAPRLGNIVERVRLAVEYAVAVRVDEAFLAD